MPEVQMPAAQMPAVPTPEPETHAPAPQAPPPTHAEAAVPHRAPVRAPVREPIREPLSLRTNFSWTLVGNAVYAVCQWAMLVALTKLCTTAMVGQFALALAITGPVFVFAGLNLRTVQVTDARRDFSFRDYLSLRLWCIAAGLAFVVALEFASRHSAHLFLVVLMAASAKAFDLAGDIIYGLLQQHERMDRIAISQMLRGALQLAALGAAAWATRNVLWAVTAQAAASLAVLAAYDVPNAAWIRGHTSTRLLSKSDTSFLSFRAKRGISPGSDAQPAGQAVLPEHSPRWRNLRTLIRLSLPLGLVAMLGSLMVNIPRYFIEHSAGMTALAVYSAMSYALVAGGMVASALCQAAAPRLARYYVADRRLFRRLLLQLVGIAAANGLFGVLGAAFFGRWFLTVMYRPEYARYPSVFTWLMVAGGVSYVGSALGFGVSAARKFDIQLPIHLCVVLVISGTCSLLISRRGLLGAAFASLSGALALVTCFTLVLIAATRERRNALSMLHAETGP